MSFVLEVGEVLKGEFRLGSLNLLLVFQVNCPGCTLHALPLANRLHAAFGERGLTVLGLSTAFEDFELNTPERTRACLGEIAFPVAFDRIARVEGGDGDARCGLTFARNALAGTPTWILLDAEAEILARELGHPSEPALVAWLEQRLGRAEARA